MLVSSLLGAAGLVAGNPSLASPVPNCTYAQINSGGCSLTSGDKTTTSFTATNTLVPLIGANPATGWENSDFFTITNNGTTWSLTWDFTPGSLPTNAIFAAGYQLSITDPTKLLDTAKISYVGSAGTFVPAASISISGGPSLNTGSPTTGSFSGAVSSSTVSYAFVVPLGSTLSSVTLELTQKDRTASVPGPLSLMGAGAAFAYSRRMRARIRSVA